jgi:outer membrane protein
MIPTASKWLVKRSLCTHFSKRNIFTLATSDSSSFSTRTSAKSILSSTLFLAVAAITGQALAQNAYAENLIDIYQLAVLHDARMASALGAHQAGVEKLPQGRSQLLPTLTVNSEKMYSDSEITYDDPSPFESGARSYEDTKYSATLTQPLYRKQNFAAYKQSKAQMAAAEAQLSLARQDLMLRVAQAYFDLLSTQQVLAAAIANTAAMKAQDDKGRIQLSLGSGSRLEASEARAKYEMARARELAVRDELVNKQQALRRITSKSPGYLDELKSGFPLVQPDPSDVTAWVKMAVQENPQLQALHFNAKAARQEVERAQAIIQHWIWWPNTPTLTQRAASTPVLPVKL